LHADCALAGRCRHPDRSDHGRSSKALSCPSLLSGGYHSRDDQEPGRRGTGGMPSVIAFQQDTRACSGWRIICFEGKRHRCFTELGLSPTVPQSSRSGGSSAQALDSQRDRGGRHREGSRLLGGLARRYLFEKMAFATLIRFSGPVTPAFLAEVARHRETDFGTFSINAFEIVRTDKFLSNKGTEIIARIAAEHG
jgi:hypothetical protein